MKRILTITILLIVVTGLVNAQNYIDQIITKSSDTIYCKITYVNDQNIFYTTQKRKTEKHSNIYVNDIISYNWKTENEKTKDNFAKNTIPYDSTSNWKTGIMAIQQINYPISHSIIAFNLSKKNHNIYLGPNYTYLFNNYFGDELVNVYKNYSIGINTGYRYIIDSKWEKINLFLQIDFSIYKVEYKEYHGHGSGVVDIERLVIENNASIGVNYRISEKLELYGGLGIGSTEYFFLMIEQFIPHSYFGLKYMINKNVR